MPVRRDRNYDEAERVILENTRKAIAKAGIIVQREMKRTLSKSGGGRKHPGARRPSSAPGQPPALQTGTLRRSIQIDAGRIKHARPTVRIGTNLDYGRHLEFGTGPYAITAKRARVLVAGHGKNAVVLGKSVKHPGLKARPWARPSLMRARKPVLALFDDLAEGMRSP